MILPPLNNALPSGSNILGSPPSFSSKNNSVSSNELASVSLNSSVNVELSSSKVAVSAIPPIYSKPIIYSSNENQLSPSRGSSSSEALLKPSVSTSGKIQAEKGKDESKDSIEQKNSVSASTSFELSEDEIKMIEDLKARDLEVRAHEQAHKTVGGQYTGAVSLSYQAGPDGKRYAVGGEVPIDVSPISGDPQATITKMAVVSAAATAPAQPSAQDQMVGAQAARLMSEAQAELAQKKYEGVSDRENEQKENNKTKPSSNFKSNYTSNSLDQFQLVAANDNEKVNLVDALV
tara:strand:+ start:15965 stop:16837 length:873 start_codon:yes stop_codon:yes gene_type:complete